MAFDPREHAVDESLRIQARSVVEWLGGLGINVNPTSRFGRYAKILDGASRDASPLIPADDPDIDTARWGVQEVQVMRFILEYPPPEAQLAEWLRLLREACKDDATLPPLDTRFARGRNAQHHLFCGAVCIKAGMFRGYLEPDLQVEFEEKAWGIACKRLKSPLQLREQVCDARNQILRQGIPGVIVMDLTEALNPGNEHLPELQREEELGSKTVAAMSGFMGNHNFKDWLDTTWVRGLICIYKQRLQTGRNSMGITTTTLFVPCCWRHDVRRAEFDRFQKSWSRGLPTLAETPRSPSLHTLLDARDFFKPDLLANRQFRAARESAASRSTAHRERS